MQRILTGLDTEYGFCVEGRSVQDQVEDATRLVTACPFSCFVGWNDADEAPRKDLRGFTVENLAVDPTDALLDLQSVTLRPGASIRADRVLTNGARLYNDHGHPEYATPECESVSELVMHDACGDLVVRSCAQVLARSLGQEVAVYKNNTDFHGACYGSHENYLVPREVGFQRLYDGLVPLFVARQVLTGAGTTARQSGDPCTFQMSQRADFITETASVDTLFKRPLFNTRDEPHTNAVRWIRLHVICGESNMSPTALAIKVGLVKIALALIVENRSPAWRMIDPVRSVRSVSRAVDSEGQIELEGGGTTTPRHVIESYLDAYDHSGHDDAELGEIGQRVRRLLEARFRRAEEFAFSVDWAAKRAMIQSFIEDEAASWTDPIVQSLDLEYHRLDKDQGLYEALEEQQLVEPRPDPREVENRVDQISEPTRAFVRSLAVTRHAKHVVSINWRQIVFRTERGLVPVELRPDVAYVATLSQWSDVEQFIMAIEAANRNG